MSKPQEHSITNVITIPKGSMVVMCGATNTGKTTFVKKHFASLKATDVFCSDDLFLKAARCANIFDTFETVVTRTETKLAEGILKGADNGHTVVLDSVSYTPHLRMANLEAFRPYFKNIVMIVIDLDIPDLLTHGSKPMMPEKARFNLFPPTPAHNALLAIEVKKQIASGQIKEGVDALHIITSETLNHTKIVIE